jgi:predicted 3-demethylubiquinone-9 3-methyltransferase (glyoxalase superfamily)
MKLKIQKINPFLWFNHNAEEAVKFYTTVFKNSSADIPVQYGDAGAKASGMPKGSVMTIDFELEGQRFTALNGGPEFKFTHAISFVVNCEDQQEIDYYWEKLSEGGSTEPCGWVKDQFGVSWQIVPSKLGKWMKGDKELAEAVMAKLMKMSKIDISELEHAYETAGRNNVPVASVLLL